MICDYWNWWTFACFFTCELIVGWKRLTNEAWSLSPPSPPLSLSWPVGHWVAVCVCVCVSRIHSVYELWHKVSFHKWVIFCHHKGNVHVWQSRNTQSWHFGKKYPWMTKSSNNFSRVNVVRNTHIQCLVKCTYPVSCIPRTACTHMRIVTSLF